MKSYDVIWYWQGGLESGKWFDASPSTHISMDLQRVEIKRMGFVAHFGTQNIGPPEGPPSKADFQTVGMIG